MTVKQIALSIYGSDQYAGLLAFINGYTSSNDVVSGGKDFLLQANAGIVSRYTNKLRPIADWKELMMTMWPSGFYPKQKAPRKLHRSWWKVMVETFVEVAVMGISAFFPAGFLIDGMLGGLSTLAGELTADALHDGHGVSLKDILMSAVLDAITMGNPNLFNSMAAQGFRAGAERSLNSAILRQAADLAAGQENKFDWRGFVSDVFSGMLSYKVAALQNADQALMKYTSEIDLASRMAMNVFGDAVEGHINVELEFGEALGTTAGDEVNLAMQNAQRTEHVINHEGVHQADVFRIGKHIWVRNDNSNEEIPNKEESNADWTKRTGLSSSLKPQSLPRWHEDKADLPTPFSDNKNDNNDLDKRSNISQQYVSKKN